jgi:heme-degrading monooxygenase HmoA
MEMVDGRDRTAREGEKGGAVITVLASFVMAEGRDLAWEDVWQRAIAVCGQQPGLRRARLLRVANQPRCYMLHSEWDDRADANRFIRTSGLQWLVRGLGIFADHPTVTYYEAVGEVFEAL